ncbi:thermonuclease family protein [Devosia rhodophyticola]|uniref:Thermonuclease family protein n=1 Tax=Devosia rhodophyticola TaxID=3026423 RepID=A0ABY7YU02_9HYPH|nr:thermonuclease family protein [Devosia rhodophyticola]WDR04672.1 thermonuclease family protein [Devosia rhodophyticola]
MLKSTIASIAAVAAFSASLVDAQACAQLRPGPVGTVVQVTDGDTIVLDSGLVVRMIGTQAPKLPLGREGFEVWPKAEESKVALEKLALHQQVRLEYGGAQVDRYDRALAHVYIKTETGDVWAQEAMVEQGLARVYSFADNRRCLDQLYAAEGARARQGLAFGATHITAFDWPSIQTRFWSALAIMNWSKAGCCWPTKRAGGSISTSGGGGRKISPRSSKRRR